MAVQLPQTLLDHAITYADRGWHLIPVPLARKRPVISGWQKLRIARDELAHVFTTPGNLGVLLGAPSGDLVDVDLDAPEALAVATALLPPTALRSGRPSAPNTHWFYVAPGGKTVRFRDPLRDTGDERAMVVELRTTGSQTLLPPSIHPSGETLRWEAAGAPSTVEADVLRRQVQVVAAAALLARYWPAPGSRHEAALALSGGLLRAGLTPDDVQRVVAAVMDAAGDPEPEDRIRGVTSTVDALNDNRATTGWTSLAQLIDPKVVQRVRAWFGASAASTTERTLLDGTRPPGQTAPRTPGTRLDAEASQATRIVELALAAGFSPFRDVDGHAYCSAPYAGHLETWPIKAERLKHHLSRVYFADAAKVPSAQMLADARHMVEGHARFGDRVMPVGVRVLLTDHTIYLDLGTERWEVVVVTASGWSIRAAADLPVRFRRPTGILPLPVPRRDGDVNALRPLVNLADEDDFLLLTGWMLALLYPTGPRPLLQLLGEQGSAKSSAARTIRSVVDPNLLPLRAAPDDEDDLLIAARNSAVLAYDNLSKLPQWLSDAFCRLATGGGLSKRQLYTDDEEVLLDAKRPVLVTGIADVVTASDLLDRCLTVTLPPIPGPQRRTERELDQLVRAAAPRILGGLLDAAVVGLQRVDGIVLDRAPRMADVAAWVEACAPALGWEAGHFLDVFLQNRRAADAIAIEEVANGPAVISFMEARESWEGTAAELLKALTACTPESTTKESRWPKQPNRVASMLRRLAPNLRQLGIDCRFQRAQQGRRLITLRRTAPLPPDGPLAYRVRDETAPIAVPAASGEGQDHRCLECGQPTGGDPYRCPSCIGIAVARNEAIFAREEDR
jgi:hypothetical protein